MKTLTVFLGTVLINGDSFVFYEVYGLDSIVTVEQVRLSIISRV